MTKTALEAPLCVDRSARVACRDSIALSRCITLVWLFTLLLLVTAYKTSNAQGIADPDAGLRIEAINITITNPSADAAFNARIEDLVRRSLGVFPFDRYQATSIDFALAIARRNTNISSVNHSVTFGPTGGVILDVQVTLGGKSQDEKARGVFASKDPGDFPVLYDRDGTLVRAKLEALSMYYGNRNAWYGRPDLMLAGNPLVKGKPAGAGYSNWMEGFIHAGVYGITPLSDSASVYGGLSAITSGSAGQELFTDQSRVYSGVEDAYIGIVGGVTTTVGNRFVYNASAGRQRFSIGDGFLIANSAANGQDRAGLQSNPRWAADQLLLAQLKYNNTKFEAFHLDPDELPVIDSKTQINGLNLETRVRNQLDLGTTFLYVPKSNYAYYTPTGTYSREGLQVYDARARWQPNPAALPGPFLATEGGYQRNINFDMSAYAFYGEAGWSFANLPWSPTLSYRYAEFSGDNPNTTRYERWDPLFSGGNGEQWVEGINHFKVFQNSNLVAHRIQLRLRPNPKLELVPQIWLFRAKSTTNIGGNPALTYLDSKDLGYEVNMTVKYFFSQRVFLQGHVAATYPGKAINSALGSSAEPWISTMLFLRIAY